MTTRAPREKFWQGKVCQIVRRLFDDKVIDNRQIGRGKAKLGEHQVNAVHPKGKLVLQPAHVSLFEAGSVGDDKGALAFVNTLKRGKPANALPPPGMEVSGRQLREATDRVVGCACNVPQKGRRDLLYRLLHGSVYSVLNLAVAPPSTTRACPVIKEDCS